MTKLHFITSASLDASAAAKPRARRLPSAASFPKGGEVPTDPGALQALAWLDRGQPQGEILYDEDSPKQTREELAQFRRTNLRRVAGKKVDKTHD